MSELVIACLSQKGGVGKSTLARLMARTYADAGWRVKICDFNTKQKTSVDWVGARLQAGHQPEIAAEPYTSVKNFKREPYDLLVVDGKPDSDVTSLEAARVASLIIVPTDVMLDDLQPQVLFANELVAKGVDRSRVIFAFNKAQSGTVQPQKARDYITGVGYRVAENELQRLTPYSLAQNNGLAISESDNSSFNERANALALELVAMVTASQENAA